jgi:hypothetical protein
VHTGTWHEERDCKGTVVRNNILCVGGGQDFSALKVPRQCPLAFQVKIYCKEGKAMGNGLCYEYRKKFEHGLCCLQSEFLI